MAMRAVIFAFLLGGAALAQAEEAAKPAGKAPSPLISTELFTSTYEILSNIGSSAYTKAGVPELLKKIPFDVAQKQFDELYAKVPPEAKKVISEAQTAAVQIKGTVYEKMGKALEAVEAPAETAKTKIETAIPALKGLIGKGVANQFIFVIYMLVVVYIVLKVVMFVLRLVKSIFCFCCCCGCCRGKKAATNEAKDSGKKAKGQAKANGKKK